MGICTSTIAMFPLSPPMVTPELLPSHAAPPPTPTILLTTPPPSKPDHPTTVPTPQFLLELSLPPIAQAASHTHHPMATAYRMDHVYIRFL